MYSHQHSIFPSDSHQDATAAAGCGRSWALEERVWDWSVEERLTVHFVTNVAMHLLLIAMPLLRT